VAAFRRTGRLRGALLACLGMAIASAAPDTLQAALSIRDDAHAGWLNRHSWVWRHGVIVRALLLVARRFSRQRLARQESA